MSIRYCIGVDEAGRGPLAGPLAVGVVQVYRGDEKTLFAGIRDSKQLSEKYRAVWFKKIIGMQKEDTLDFAVAMVGARIIDERGVTNATQRAINRALRKLAPAPEQCELLLDGLLAGPRTYPHQHTIVKGDEQIPLIAAASIVAKVKRDRVMCRLAKRYPAYGFEKHKGYGTREHKMHLRQHGPCPIHRQRFLSRI